MSDITTDFDISDVQVRCQIYGQLAQAFVYPEPGIESVLTAVDYTDAFDPACSPQACSIRGYSYAKDVHPTALHEELLRFYHFFGLTRSADAQMPDHISVQLEFMQFLNKLEASAMERGEDILPLKRARRDFLERHLRIIAHGIEQSMKVDTPSCRFLAQLTVHVVDDDLACLHEDIGLGGDAAA